MKEGVVKNKTAHYKARNRILNTDLSIHSFQERDVRMEKLGPS